MVFEKLTSLERLADGFPFLLTAVVVHGLGLTSGLAAVRVHALSAAGGAASGGAVEMTSPVGARHGTLASLPWIAGEAALLLALPLVWWIGFILGPTEPTDKSLVNSLLEPALVAALGVTYLVMRRRVAAGFHVGLRHFALLAMALAAAGVLGWLMPPVDFGSPVP